VFVFYDAEEIAREFMCSAFDVGWSMFDVLCTKNENA